MNAHQASSTARLIAVATIMREYDGNRAAAAPLGTAVWFERLLSRSRTDGLIVRSVRSPIGRALWRGVERLALPGIVSHWMRRKQEIDGITRAAAGEGFSQLVVIGAGLDTLAHRMVADRTYPRVISADHPATLAAVRDALDGTATGPAMVELDLMNADVCSVLESCPSFDPARPTLVVIEGVLMYLPEGVVTRVFRSLAELPVPSPASSPRGCSKYRGNQSASSASPSWCRAG